MNPNNRDSAHRPVEVVVVTQSSGTSKVLKAIILLVVLVIMGPIILAVLGVGVTLGVGAFQASKDVEQPPVVQDMELGQ